MATTGRSRRKGRIETLPSGSLRVVVYAGVDPVSGKRHFLRELVPAGPRAQKEAERVLRRLASEVDDEKNPKTTATVDQLLDKHFELLEIEPTTLSTYRTLCRKHVRPLIGRQKVGALRASIFDAFYAELRRCRDHCDRRDKTRIDHRTAREHRCDHRCGVHVCRPLSKSTIRQVHVILSGALRRAVRWGWINRNPIELADPPPSPTPNARPPTAAEAAQLLAEAGKDPEWGLLVWLTMVTGFRRGELCALRWGDVDLESGTLTIERSIAQLDDRTWMKDTKTHHQRRIALDEDSRDALGEHRDRCSRRAAAAGTVLADEAFVFSPAPDGSQYLVPRSVSQRYGRMAKRLGIKTTIHKLRHYSATELISAGVDVRTVAGRLGHGGGGTTTLRVYAAWISEADQRAAQSLATRLPARPQARLDGSAGPLTG
ncbi:site-specific integrase [Pseudonocardia sp. C8]|uniref:site-specific integrase n=1 Tax=Pseudonocardia sp. C8 TaxID=2762759 RepID=UPI0016435BD2|nr:site-specific integrase [Pseudonocardia sp. C8]MBC3191674.1 site-specific integrase [Pseudonocardia sp. C8]